MRTPIHDSQPLERRRYAVSLVLEPSPTELTLAFENERFTGEGGREPHRLIMPTHAIPPES